MPRSLDFGAEKTREKHGRRKRFRQLISGMPTGRLRARLTAMADQTGITIIAVDPAYTSGIRSGDGRHRPHTTGVIVRGIGPSRPTGVFLGVRDPALPFPDHGHDPCRRTVERTRATRTPNAVRSVRLNMNPGNRTHSRSVLRNGWAYFDARRYSTACPYFSQSPHLAKSNGDRQYIADALARTSLLATYEVDSTKLSRLPAPRRTPPATQRLLRRQSPSPVGPGLHLLAGAVIDQGRVNGVEFCVVTAMCRYSSVRAAISGSSARRSRTLTPT